MLQKLSTLLAIISCEEIIIVKIVTTTGIKLYKPTLSGQPIDTTFNPIIKSMRVEI